MDFSRERRVRLQKWIIAQLKGAEGSFDAEVFRELVATLGDVEGA